MDSRALRNGNLGKRPPLVGNIRPENLHIICAGGCKDVRGGRSAGFNSHHSPHIPPAQGGGPPHGPPPEAPGQDEAMPQAPEAQGEAGAEERM